MSSSAVQILPPIPEPAEAIPERRHAPSGAYESFRECLRWELGFTCAFCLLHETDLASLGAEGLALMWIEHVRLKSGEGDRDEYVNYTYSCRMCNAARGRKPSVARSGASLLDPTAVAWGERFVLTGDSLVPRDQHDADALYTWRAYDLDDSRKVDRRRHRREEIAETWEQLELAVHDAERVDHALQTATGSRRRELLAKRRQVSILLSVARRVLLQHRAVPLDAAEGCACGVLGAASLPPALQAQCRALSE